MPIIIWVYISQSVNYIKRNIAVLELEPVNSVNNKSKNKLYEVNLTPQIIANKKIVIPVSMGRYDISAKKTKEYDYMLSALFTCISEKLKTGEISSVDVISTCELQGINWNNDTIKKIETHFYQTHKAALQEQTNFFTWNNWIDTKGREEYQDYYNLVLQKSDYETEWYDLMVRTHGGVSLDTNLENSLEYQRQEYAAILLMQSYDYLVYTGSISLAWSYLYRLFPQNKLPVFVKAEFSKTKKANSIASQADAMHTTKMILTMIEQTLTSSNFPEEEKKKIIDRGMSLFYAYEPRNR